MPAVHLQPVQQLTGRQIAPARGQGGGGGRSANPHGRQLGPRQHVEQARLARSGRAGQRDHGRLPREGEASVDLSDDPLGLRDGRFGDPSLTEFGGPRQGPYALRQPALAGRGRRGPARSHRRSLGPCSSTNSPSTTSPSTTSAARTEPAGSCRTSVPSSAGWRWGRRDRRHLLGRHRLGNAGAADPIRGGPQCRGLPRRLADLVQRGVVAHELVGQQRLHACVQVLLGRLGEPADGLITEHRLQDALRQHRGSAGHPDLGPHQPAGVGEDDDHERDADPVHAESEEPGLGAPAHPLVGDEVQDGPLPIPDDPRGRCREGGRGTAEIVLGSGAGSAGRPRGPATTPRHVPPRRRTRPAAAPRVRIRPPP